MNSSQYQYMDKKIMDLAAESSPIQPPGVANESNFIDLAARHDTDHGSRTNEGIDSSYSFQPVRSSNPVSSIGLSPGIRNYSDSFEPANVIMEKDRNNRDSTFMSEMEQTMKKLADNLLHALEGVSSRLTQLETRSHNLENSVDGLKVFLGNNHGSSDGKMRQLENILRAVETGVQIIRDKQEIMETQFQLAKAQILLNPQTEALKSSHAELVQLSPSLPAQPFRQPSHGSLPQSVPALPNPNATLPPPPPVVSQPNLPPSQALVQNQFPAPQIAPAQREPYFPQPGPGQTQEAPTQYQQYQLPSAQLALPPPPAVPPPPYQYPPHSQPQYLLPAHPLQPYPSSLPMTSPQLQLVRHAEESPYLPLQTFQPNVHQTPSQTPTGQLPPLQQYYRAAPQIYQLPPPQRSSSGFSPGYGLPSGPNEASYGGGPHYGNSSSVKSQQQGGVMGSGYVQLPTARVLPDTPPTVSVVTSGSGSDSSGNRVPINEVVDKVTSMGFSRDQVRATVRRLTENGQAVDLNVVLDKLMNDSDVQPPGGWFVR